MSASVPITASPPAADGDVNRNVPSGSPVSPLDALRAVDFDWTLHLASVWAEPRFDVDGLHAHVRRELLTTLDDLASRSVAHSPLGRVIVGSGGTGKTHLLSFLRNAATERGCSFVLIDMTAVRDFPTTVLQGLVDSLGRAIEGPDGLQPQYRMLLRRLLETFDLAEPVSRSLDKLERFDAERLQRNTTKLLTALNQRHPTATMQFQDAFRALIAMNSRDFTISSLGLRWLQASELESEERRLLGFTRSLSDPFEIVRAMSWLMSLCGPAVLAFDQLDPIVHQLQLPGNLADESNDLPHSVLAARSIVEQIAGGLSALRDLTRRTLLIVSCVEATLDVLRRHALRQDLERFEAPLLLGSLPDDVIARSVIGRRLDAAFKDTGFTPPWSTWPFRTEAFRSLQGTSPREILKLCAQHQRRCLGCREVIELSSFSTDEPAVVTHSAPAPVDHAAGAIDAEFERLKGEADLSSLLSNLRDDELLAPLLQTACHCLLHEHTLPAGVQAVVETDFGTPRMPPLHARLKLIDQTDQTERHLCLRALQRDHPTAFQTRLKAALTASGIGPEISFRQLIIIRRQPVPSGPVTNRLITEFHTYGGHLCSLPDSELRTLWALHHLRHAGPTGFFDWLAFRRPMSGLSIFQNVIRDWLTVDSSEVRGSAARNLSRRTSLNREGSP